MKMKNVIFIFVLITTLTAQVKYEANWESLDKRPIPEWYSDAKLGIFIHWGVYSVPAYTAKGGYAEWYWKGYNNKKSKIWDFHKRVYGENYKYEDFAKEFKAELFDPEEWTEYFHKSGAKYVVLTSKHHDGFCLWPSKESKNWNSVKTGAQKDLVKELTDAVRKTDLKMGLYYSLAEWTNPLYMWTINRKNNNRKKYVDEYMIPQLKDLVTRYKPSVIFADGEWDHSSKEWRSEEFLSWLYNESKAPKDIVVNDRWGGETRFKHGGYYSTEYTSGLSNENHPWEECRGMGSSFGYNRNESINEYKTGKQLIHMLIKLVSNGGNLLLNIGPNADGRIPVIMQERLLQIGKWLKVNGEAIYATRKWSFNSEHKNIRYTSSKNGENIYAILLKWPGNKLNLKRVQPDNNSQIYLLGYHKPLKWNYDTKNGLIITIPSDARDYLEDELSYAYSFKITGHKSNILTTPKVITKFFDNADSTIFYKNIELDFFTNGNDIKYYYTTDGSEPDFNSNKTDNKITIDKSCRLKVFAHSEGNIRSLTKEVVLVKNEAQKNNKIENIHSGVNTKYYNKTFYALPDFSKIKPDSVFISKYFTIPLEASKDHFAYVYEGYLKIDITGIYKFYLRSDDGSKLYINNKLVTNNDGLHGNKNEKWGMTVLKEGYHKFRLEYFENKYDQSIFVEYQSEKIKKQKLPEEILFH